MHCRTQLHHAKLHDFSAKRARLQEAPGAELPDLYLPFWFGKPKCSFVLFCTYPKQSVFSQEYLQQAWGTRSKVRLTSSVY